MPKLVAIASATDQLDPFSRGLLFLARTDAAVTTLGQEKSMPLDTVCRSWWKSWPKLAKGITITSTSWHNRQWRTPTEPFFPTLVENALKYTPKGVCVHD